MVDPVAGDSTVVDVKSSWASKINWAQGIGILSTVVALVSGNKYNVPPEQQLTIVASIQGLVSTFTWVARTWFSSSVTAASVAK